MQENQSYSGGQESPKKFSLENSPSKAPTTTSWMAQSKASINEELAATFFPSPKVESVGLSIKLVEKDANSQVLQQGVQSRCATATQRSAGHLTLRLTQPFIFTTAIGKGPQSHLLLSSGARYAHTVLL